MRLSVAVAWQKSAVRPAAVWQLGDWGGSKSGSRFAAGGSWR